MVAFFMSAEQFSKLSLGEDMVTTRAGAARAARASAQSSDHSDQDQPLPSVESTVSPTPSLVISTKNLHYNVSAFDTDLRRRAKKGLEGSEIRLKYCAVSEDEYSPGGSPKKFFHLEDEITVAMGGRLRRPECTCGANEKGLACKTLKHIYWVGDQIISTSPDDMVKTPLHLSPDGSKIEDVKPAEILDTKGLANIANDLKWVYRDDDDLPEDDDDLKETVIDMFSCFEPRDALPGEFRYPESPLTSERSKKYQELADLFTQYASRDPSLYLQMRKIIDADFESRVFFEKVEKRIALTFDALDEYIVKGPKTLSEGPPRFDVSSCAEQLTSLVGAIDDFYHRQADVEDAAARAAMALVTILDRVTDRNVNAYEGITWSGMEALSDPVQSNLYVALIGAQTDDDHQFVLEALASLPQEDVYRNHWTVLQDVERKLIEADAPAHYMNLFRNLVYENRKRPGSAVREREPKRAMQ
ncbi:hypothetical protein J4E82_003350 [Alternaria postmessia]|uniref:uncharacterized protein n=1 Tax=Alternaria postmessia TaxID=1187938 RepID=UPI0022244304|nr:uncharacterized protein J4E82_003350 [Alternaria postmessia]KAI5377968.1 hypothetical protein J4E82_003350 [Alternaria postmessia]